MPDCTFDAFKCLRWAFRVNLRVAIWATRTPKIADTGRVGRTASIASRGKDRIELFDLDRDIGETVNLLEKMYSKTDELHGLLEDHLTELNADSGKKAAKTSSSAERST